MTFDNRSDARVCICIGTVLRYLLANVLYRQGNVNKTKWVSGKGKKIKKKKLIDSPFENHEDHYCRREVARTAQAMCIQNNAVATGAVTAYVSNTGCAKKLMYEKIIHAMFVLFYKIHRFKFR